jgi:hypothetical protein
VSWSLSLLVLTVKASVNLKLSYYCSWFHSCPPQFFPHSSQWSSKNLWVTYYIHTMLQDRPLSGPYSPLYSSPATCVLSLCSVALLVLQLLEFVMLISAPLFPLFSTLDSNCFIFKVCPTQKSIIQGGKNIFLLMSFMKTEDSHLGNWF